MKFVSQISSPATISSWPFSGILWCSRLWASRYSEIALAKLTTATRPIVSRRRIAWRPSSVRGVASSRPTTRTASSAGSRKWVPTASRSGRLSCSAIAAITVIRAGQVDSGAPGGG